MTKPSPSGPVKPFEPQVLYRFWKDETLLYVGISQSFFSRMDSHNHTKDWFGAVTHVTLEHFPTRRSVELAEKTAIKREQPLFNIIYNKNSLQDKTRITKLEPIVDKFYFYEIPETPEGRKQLLSEIRSSRNGYTRETLERLRIVYPPQKGWRSRFIQTGLSKTK